MISKVEQARSVGQLLPSLLRHLCYSEQCAYRTPNASSSWCTGHTFVGYPEHMNRQGISRSSSGYLHVVCLIPNFVYYDYERHAFCIPTEMKSCCLNLEISFLELRCLTVTQSNRGTYYAAAV